jgi:hypothetical protein
MIAADADAVRHSRFVDKRLDYERLVAPLMKSPPVIDLDFSDISKTFPKYTPAAAVSLISSFGPSAV